MALIYPDKIKIGNPSASGIVDILEVAGSRQVATKADLYTLSGAILSPSFDITTGDGNVNNDAIGIEFYVVDEGTFYYLTDWSKRSEAAGWSTRAVGEATGDTAGTVIVSTADDESRANAVYSASKTRSLIEASASTLQDAIDDKADATALADYQTTATAATEKQALEGQIALKANSADVYTKGEVDAKVSSVYRVKGTKPTEEELPTEGNVFGDVWNVEATGDNFVWTEEGWDKLAGVVDLSKHLTIESAASTYATKTELSGAQTTLQSAIDNKVAKADFEAYQGTVTTALSNKVENSVFTEEVEKLQTKADAATETSRVDAAIALKADITALNSAKSELEGKITTLETNVGNTYQTKAEAATEHETISGEIDAVQLALQGEIDELSGKVTDNESAISGINTTLSSKADADKVVPITRKVAGHALDADVTLSKSDVGLGNVDNTSDLNKPISTATQAALELKANDSDVVHTSVTVNGHALTGNIEVTASDLGLDKVNNTSDLDKPISTATQAALDTKADAASLANYVPTTRTVAGKALSADVTLEKADVGLGNVDNTSDADKPISTATQAALDDKADKSELSSYVDLATDGQTITGKKIFTEVEVTTLSAESLTLDNLVLEGTTSFETLPEYTGTADATDDQLITKGQVNTLITTATQNLTKEGLGLGNVDNTSDADKPVSTAQQAALDTKVGLTGNESIDGVKTFTSLPVVPTTTEDVKEENVASVAYVTSAIQTAAEGIATKKYSVKNPQLDSTNGKCTWTITHNLGSEDVVIQLFEVATKSQVFADVEITSTNVCVISMNSSETIAADTYKVVVV